jgi:mannose-1-phosphate guanylyltransferase
VPLIAREHAFVLVSAEQAAPFRRALRKLIPRDNLIIEPEGRGTAVAIAYGAGVIAQRFGTDAALAVMPADHYIKPGSAFRHTLKTALGIASDHAKLVVVGVPPTRPESGYGYQEIGGKFGTGFELKRFVEKPPPQLARRMVASGRFLWNAGIFVLRADTLAAEFRRYAPALAEAMETLPRSRGAALAAAYKKLQFDSFDRVVIEKSRCVVGVRASFEWHDVGSWEGLWEALRSKSRNVFHGKVLALDTEGVLARSGKRLMVLLGVDDLIAVDSDDAILIARRSRSQEIRRIIDELSRTGLTRYL